MTAPVVRLDAVGQGLMASVSHRAPQDPADRPPVGRRGLRRDARRRALGHVDQAPQDAPGSMRVPGRAAHGGEEPPLAVDGARARAPAPGDVHVGLVQGSGAAGVAAPASRAADPRAAGRRGPPRRGSARGCPRSRASRGDASARRAARCRSGPGDRCTGAGPLVEPPPTGPAAAPPGAERGAPLPLRRGRGCTVGTHQPRPLTIPRMRRAEASEP